MGEQRERRRTRMGEPLKQHLSIMIEPAMRERIDALADQRGVTRGAVVRHALESGIANVEAAENEGAAD